MIIGLLSESKRIKYNFFPVRRYPVALMHSIIRLKSFSTKSTSANLDSENAPEFRGIGSPFPMFAILTSSQLEFGHTSSIDGARIGRPTFALGGHLGRLGACSS